MVAKLESSTLCIDILILDEAYGWKSFKFILHRTRTKLRIQKHKNRGDFAF